MYIPTWIFIGIIILWIYYVTNKRPSDFGNKDNTLKDNYSYRLDIYIEANWRAIYKKLCSPKSESNWKKFLSEKIRESKDENSSLWGRRYYFTEYYDSISGLTTRFQRIICQNGNQFFYPVDEFGDRGYIFNLIVS
jgi:hypothetical protein